jgi:acyl-CoA synthetase (AMP-forming)/AMP-acid ligase II
LPKTPAGKIHRRKLREQELAHSVAVLAVHS